jgi:hypothetical protein
MSRLSRLAFAASTRAGKRAAKKYQAAARREWSKTELAQITRELDKYTRGRGSQGRRKALLDRLADKGGQAFMAKMQAAGGVEKYAARETVAFAIGQLTRALGPLGKLFGVLLEAQRGRTSLQRQLETATRFLEAFGYDVIPPKAKRSRELQAALESIQEEGVKTPRGRRPEQVAEEQAEQVRAGGAPSGVPGGPRAPGTQTMGKFHPGWRPGVVYAPPGAHEESAYGVEIKTPNSSNVFAFSFKPETERAGTLYVTFKPWWPGQKGDRPNARGPLYAYFDVPIRSFETFQRKAQNDSAGGAVWTYLRVRGSRTDHQYDYRLVYGAVIPEFAPASAVPGGVYIPRKIQQRGYQKRAGYHGFSLPSRFHEVNRAFPNRGEPNRGEPNRGR